MATHENINDLDVWTITSADGGTKASFIPELGGIGSSIVMPAAGAPRELLYHHEWFWDRDTDETRGGWPFLFPICGRVMWDGEPDRCNLAGAVREMPIHGFGMRLPWTVEEEGPDALTLALEDSEATQAAYPFRFRIGLSYRVEAGALTARLTVENRGDEPMPYYAGFHPYFLTPPVGGGKDDVRLDFQSNARYRYNDTFTDLAGEEAPPPRPVCVTDESLVDLLALLDEDRKVRLSYPEGYRVGIEVTGEEDAALFPYLQCYTLPEEPFFCAEPWMNYPNTVHRPEKLHTLAPGTAEHANLRLWVEE